MSETVERNKKIIELYLSGQVTTKNIAKEFSLDRKQVQRIVKQANLSVDRIERLKMTSHLKVFRNYRYKSKFAQIPDELRNQFLQNNPQCSVCGILRFHGTLLEVCPINPKLYHELKNLRTVCRKCIKKLN